MGTLDWIVVAGYFVVMVGIGLWSRGRVKNIADFFTAGGKMPWWLSGISHHMSGYSAVMFVAFAAEAYRLGLTVYIWWSLTIGIGVGIGAFLWAPAWNRLRAKHDVKSPLEYLAIRYNVPTQQVMAWAGAGLKVVDIAAKWVAVALLLQGFAGVPIGWGIGLVGVVTMVYSVLGGLWADALTDFGQFIIQGRRGLRDVLRGRLALRRHRLHVDDLGQAPPEPQRPADRSLHADVLHGALPDQDARVQRRHVEPRPALHGGPVRLRRASVRHCSPPPCGSCGRSSCSSRCGRRR